VNVLLLGGPKFLGRAVADAALARGHRLTFFNRGRTSPELYPEVQKLRGDRDGGLEALGGGTWDVVVDTSGYVPHVVRASAQALADAGRYCFVSSVSVYADFSGPVAEASPVAALGDHPVDELLASYENYGALKALCEDAVRERFGERALIIRPGLIVGPYDPTGRFTYWPHRTSRGGEMLVPGPAERRVQFIDVRDLGTWIIELCEREVGGVFNATNSGVRWDELLAACGAVASTDARPVWVTDSFLVEHEVGEWMELPLWIGDPDWTGLHATDVSRALGEGLRFRRVEETVRGALDDADLVEGVGLTADREAMLLQEWHGR
jgi:2'-hydroxyisoflavone reductase